MSDRARAIGHGGVPVLVAAAILAGVLRYPAVLGTHFEALAMLPLPDPRLAAIRDAMVEAAFDSRTLESGGLALILEQGGHAAVSGELIRTNALAFSFLRSDADPVRAARDLGAAIAAVVERADLEAARDRATARFKANPDDEAAFAEQMRLVAACHAAASALASLEVDRDDRD